MVSWSYDLYFGGGGKQRLSYCGTELVCDLTFLVEICRFIKSVGWDKKRCCK